MRLRAFSLLIAGVVLALTTMTTVTPNDSSGDPGGFEWGAGSSVVHAGAIR